MLNKAVHKLIPHRHLDHDFFQNDDLSLRHNQIYQYLRNIKSPAPQILENNETCLLISDQSTINAFFKILYCFYKNIDFVLYDEINEESFTKSNFSDFIKEKYKNVYIWNTEFNSQINETFHDLSINENITDETLRLYNAIKNSNSNFWIGTSGSTSNPKYCQFKMQQILASIEQMNHFYKLSTIRSKNQNKMIWPTSLPLHHVGGLMIFLRSYFLGLTVIDYNSKALRCQQGTTDTFLILSLVPTQVHQLLHKKKSLLKNADIVIISGAKISKNLLSQLSDSMNKSQSFYLSYGATETLSGIAACKLTPPLAPSPIYTCFKNVSIEVNKGNAQVSSPSNTITIFNDKTALNTDSIIYLNDDIVVQKSGDFLIHGRNDKTIITGGENVSPRHIEQILSDTYQLEDIVIHAMDSNKWGEEILCFYKFPSNVKSTLTREKVKQDAVLKKYEVPKYFFDLTKFSPPERKPTKKLLTEFALSNKNHIFGLHGFMGSTQDFNYLNKSFFNQIKTIEIIGHDTSISDTEFEDLNSANDSFLKTTQFILNRSDFFNASESIEQGEGVTLLGYSLGARIAAGALSLYPDKIKNCILLSSHLGNIIDEDEKKIRKSLDKILLQDISNQKEYRLFLDNWYANPIFKGIKKTTNYQSLILSKLNNKPEQLQKSLDLLGNAEMPDFTEVFKKKDYRKIHFIYGEFDYKYKAYAQMMHEKFGCSFFEIPSHSHELLQSTRGEISKIIFKILQKNN